MQLRQIQPDHCLESGIALVAARPRQRLAIGGDRRRLPSQPRVHLALCVQHPGHRPGLAEWLQTFAGPAQMLAGRGEISAAARQGREPMVQLTGRHEVSACFREPHPAREPGPRPGPLSRRQRDVAEPQAGGDGARLMKLRFRERQRPLMAPRRLGVAAQRFLQRAEGEEHIDFGVPVLKSFREPQGGLVPRPRLDPAAQPFLAGARLPQGVHRRPGLAPLLAFERLDVGGVESAHVLLHLLGGLDGALAQLRGLDRPLADGQVRAVARPLRLLLRAGGREDEAPQRQQHLQLGQEPQRLLHTQRRERVLHSPYSFILRVRVLRWMPRISAAAPICPLV